MPAGASIPSILHSIQLLTTTPRQQKTSLQSLSSYSFSLSLSLSCSGHRAVGGTGMKRLRVGGEAEMDGINLASVLMLLSRGGSFSAEEAGQGPQQPERVFECKTCGRRFPSFQALGGHRASHKKPRLAAGEMQQGQAQPRRVHECSICGLEFSIGQALGGHMRRHRATPAAAFHRAPTEKRVDGGGEKRGAACLDLDLNLSPPENEVDVGMLSLGLGLPMVDCFY